MQQDGGIHSPKLTGNPAADRHLAITFFSCKKKTEKVFDKKFYDKNADTAIFYRAVANIKKN